MRKSKIHIEHNREHLSQSELWAYSHEELGVEEMYRLELHIIDCELCSEALEGLETLADGAHFDQMIESIKREVEPPSQSGSRGWMLAAASISLIFLTSLSIWFFTRESRPEPLAQKIEQPMAEESDNNETVINEEKEDNASEDKLDVTDKKSKSEEIEAESEQPTTKIGQSADLDIDTDAIDELILDEPKVAVNVENNIMAVQSMELSAEDSNETIAERSKAVESASRVSGNKRNAAVPSAVADENLVEAPVADAAPIEGVQRKELTNITEPTPVGGQNVLRKYIRRNLRYPNSARQNNIKGEVELLLTISEDGTIKTIVVINSLGYGCDEEAIRLIQDGPDWNPGTGNNQPIEATTQVKIKFRP